MVHLSACDTSDFTFTKTLLTQLLITYVLLKFVLNPGLTVLVVFNSLPYWTATGCYMRRGKHLMLPCQPVLTHLLLFLSLMKNIFGMF